MSIPTTEIPIADSLRNYQTTSYPSGGVGVMTQQYQAPTTQQYQVPTTQHYQVPTTQQYQVPTTQQYQVPTTQNIEAGAQQPPTYKQ